MVGLDSALEDWLKQVQNLANLTLKEQAQITKAGADVFRDKLEETTRKKHYSSHKDPVYGHMADHVTVQAKDIDGQVTGVSTAGWDNPYHASNARRLNDGTKKYTADHFVTELQQSKEVLEEVLAAEKEEYQKILRKRG